MKTIYSLSLFVAFYLLVGCSKKSDPAASVCHLATSTQTFGSWSQTNTYTYDDKSRVSVVSKVSTGYTKNETYSYNAQGQITSIKTDATYGTNPTTTTNSTVTYDANGRVTLIASSSNKTAYEYNSSGQMIKESGYYYDASSSSFKSSGYSTYEYPSTNTKNYSTEKDYDDLGGLLGTTTFQYDSKSNPESILLPVYPSPTNNVTQSTLVNGSTTYNDSYTYVYNSNGFPTSVNSTETGGPNTTTGIRSFTYTNCK